MQKIRHNKLEYLSINLNLNQNELKIITNLTELYHQKI